MKAYVVFDGGGVKGAGLAGCLQAATANPFKIEFEGYGGTSAGAIVALLGSIGYSGLEIYELLRSEIHPRKMLDDEGVLLRQAQGLLVQAREEVNSGNYACTKLRHLRRLYLDNRQLVDRLLDLRGMYDGQTLRRTLIKLIVRKIPSLGGCNDITFSQLESAGGKPLKIVASNIAGRRAVVFEKSNPEVDQSVIHAVCASASYPFLFQPVVTSAGHCLVDGGVSTNLPAFLFAREHEQSSWPTIAFDLEVPSVPCVPADVVSHIGSLVDTALEASDVLLGDLVRGLKHIPIPLPVGISTLKFDLTNDELKALYDAGFGAASAQLGNWDILQFANQAGEKIQEELQAYYGDHKLIIPVLWAFGQSIANETSAHDLRVQIMLPTGRTDGSRIVVYHFGYRKGDQDKALELDEFGGCTGRANEEHLPVFADLNEAETNPDFLQEWRMKDYQQEKVAKDRAAMLAAPIFCRPPANNERPIDVPVRGIIAIDTCTPLKDTKWVVDNGSDEWILSAHVGKIATTWAEVASKLLR